MTEQGFTLTPEQRAELKELTKDGTADFWKGYQYLQQQLQAYVNNPTNAGDPNIVEHKKQLYWLGKAAGINRNDPNSIANTFIRGTTANGFRWDGTIPPDQIDRKVQENSDKIGENVIKDTLRKGELPSINNLIRNDASAAVKKGGQTYAGWGGSPYYWNTPLSDKPGDTVGNAILKNPAEYEKFIATNAKTVAEVMAKHGVLNPMAALEQLTTALDAQAPAKVKADIVNRVIEALSEGKGFEGDPNNIDGYRPKFDADGNVVGWREMTRDLKWKDVTDARKIEDLNTRRDVRVDKGINHPWQAPVPGRVDTIKLDDGTTYTHTFGRDGKLTSKSIVNPDGTRIDSRFDTKGRLTEQTSTGPAGKTVVTFDVTNGKPTFRRDYDANGKLTKTTGWDTQNTQPWSRVEESDYDANGLHMRSDHYNDDGTRLDHKVNVRREVTLREDYDAAGKLTRRIGYDPDNTQTWSRVEESDYDANGLHMRSVHFNDDGTLFDHRVNARREVTLREDYDAAGKLTRRIGFDRDNTQPWSRVEEDYDANGLLTRSVHFNDDGTRHEYSIGKNGTAVLEKRYDPAGRLIWDRVQEEQRNNAEAAERLKEQMEAARKHQEFLERVRESLQNTQLQIQQSLNTGKPSGSGIPIPGHNPSPPLNVPIFKPSPRPDPVIRPQPIGKPGGGSVGGGGGIALPPIAPIPTPRPHVPIFRPSPAPKPGGSPYIGVPVALDLDGDATLDIRSLGAAPTGDATAPEERCTTPSPRFDWTGDGIADRTAWVGPGDGLLVIDLGPDGQSGSDGKVDHAKEIAFALWKTEDEIAAENAAGEEKRAVSDLEGLRHAFDTNHDNVLSIEDERWAEFRIWQDANQNGSVDRGELLTMPEAGIKLIDLMPSKDGSRQFADGSAITGTSSAEMTDGTKMLVGDVTLAYRPSLNV